MSITSPIAVHHAAGGEEQERLEERMGEQVKHRRHDRELGDVAHARPQRHEHVAELADRRIGQHALQVVLRDGDRGRQQRGGAAGDRDQEQDARGEREQAASTARSGRRRP